MESLLDGYKTEEQKKLIAEDINETDDDKLVHNVAVLETWIKSQPHLPQDYDRRIVPTFIRGCKHNLETAKRKLDTYFSIRNLHPQLFKSRDPHGKEIQQVLDSTIIVPLAPLSPDGCRVVYIRMPPDIDNFNPDALFKTILMVADIRATQETLIRGDCFVWDLVGIGLKHVASLAGCSATRRVLQFASEAYPQRMQKMHTINMTPVAERLVNVVKLMLKPKIRNRILIHSDSQSLSSHLPPECIPADYGGAAPYLREIQDSWKLKLYEYSDWFTQQESITTDESKRPAGDVKWNRERSDQELVGSFRQIHID